MNTFLPFLLWVYDDAACVRSLLLNISTDFPPLIPSCLPLEYFFNDIIVTKIRTKMFCEFFLQLSC